MSEAEESLQRAEELLERLERRTRAARGDRGSRGGDRHPRSELSAIAKEVEAELERAPSRRPMRTADELRELVEDVPRPSSALTPELGGLDEAIRYALDGGGKRHAAGALPGDRRGGRRRARSGCCRRRRALELVHTFSLVHDDLPALDDDDERRGQPSAHVRFGEGVAILAGDALLDRGVRGSPARTSRPAVARELAQATLGMIAGQYLDITGGRRRPAELHRLKTGALFARRRRAARSSWRRRRKRRRRRVRRVRRRARRPLPARRRPARRRRLRARAPARRRASMARRPGGARPRALDARWTRCAAGHARRPRGETVVEPARLAHARQRTYPLPGEEAPRRPARGARARRDRARRRRRSSSRAACRATRRPGEQVDEEAELDGRARRRRFVSRGGEKLAQRARRVSTSTSRGLDCLDVGASTGGFTDCLLQRGAARVIALDVGYGQLAPAAPRRPARDRARADERARR